MIPETEIILPLNPEVSVLIPVYNNGDTIARAIDSVLHQHFKDFELIILNDGSDDDTLAIIDEYTDNRIRIYSHAERTGIPKARNFLLDKAKSNLICWLDADDFFHPDKISLQYQYMTDNPDIVFCSGYARMIAGNKSYLKSIPDDPELLKAVMFFKSPFVFSSVMMRKSAGRFNEKYKRAQDFDLLFQLMKEGKIGLIKKTLVSHTVYEQNVNKSDIEYTNEILDDILWNKINSYGIDAAKDLIRFTNTLCRNYKLPGKNELKEVFNFLDMIVDKSGSSKMRSYLNSLLIKTGIIKHPVFLLKIKQFHLKDVIKLLYHKV